MDPDYSFDAAGPPAQPLLPQRPLYVCALRHPHHVLLAGLPHGLPPGGATSRSTSTTTTWRGSRASSTTSRRRSRIARSDWWSTSRSRIRTRAADNNGKGDGRVAARNWERELGAEVRSAGRWRETQDAGAQRAGGSCSRGEALAAGGSRARRLRNVCRTANPGCGRCGEEEQPAARSTSTRPSANGSQLQAARSWSSGLVKRGP